MAVIVKGLAQVTAGLQALPDAVAGALQRGLEDEAGTIMEAAIDQVPVDTGALRDSGRIERPQASGREVTIAFGFGGGDVDYAVYVHEDLQATHTNGKAKYLEDPALQAVAGMDDRLTRYIDDAVARAVG